MAKQIESYTYHVCIPVQRALDDLKKGKNYLNCTPSRALKVLTEQRAMGKAYFTGCDNEDADGGCKGHPNYKK